MYVNLMYGIWIQQIIIISTKSKSNYEHDNIIIL